MPGQPPQEKLNACDVLNWKYLLELSGKHDPVMQKKSTLADGLAKLAYDLTQTGNEQIRTKQLSEFLHNLTDNTSVDAAEELLKCLAGLLRCDLGKLRQFSKENGVRLKRLKLW
jgi:hypothetical protein